MRWLLLGWLLLIFSLSKTPLRETGCLSNPYFFTYWLLRHPVFLFTPLSQHSQLGYLWLPTPYCAALAALVGLTGCYAMPLVTKCFPPKPCGGSGGFP